MNFDVLKDTGLKVSGELDCLLGVSRISVHNYLRGRTQPSVHTKPRIEKVLRVLEKVVEAGKLPFNPEIASNAERRKAAFNKLCTYVDSRI